MDEALLSNSPAGRSQLVNNAVGRSQLVKMLITINPRDTVYLKQNLHTYLFNIAQFVVCKTVTRLRRAPFRSVEVL